MFCGHPGKENDRQESPQHTIAELKSCNLGFTKPEKLLIDVMYLTSHATGIQIYSMYKAGFSLISGQFEHIQNILGKFVNFTVNDIFQTAQFYENTGNAYSSLNQCRHPSETYISHGKPLYLILKCCLSKIMFYE